MFAQLETKARIRRMLALARLERLRSDPEVARDRRLADGSAVYIDTLVAGQPRRTRALNAA